MKSRLMKAFALLLILQLLVPARLVLADTGPKPTMDFEFKQQLPGEKLTITAGTLYECEQPDCSDAEPLKELGPQRFSCEADSCHALAYGFRPYHRLELQFSDGQTRKSNVFPRTGFNSTYTVIVRPDDLLVEAQFSVTSIPRVGIVLAACLCALIGVGLIVGIVLAVRRSRKN